MQYVIYKYVPDSQTASHRVVVEAFDDLETAVRACQDMNMRGPRHSAPPFYLGVKENSTIRDLTPEEFQAYGY